MELGERGEGKRAKLCSSVVRQTQLDDFFHPLASLEAGCSNIRSSPAATGAREVQIFVKLLYGSTFTIRTLGPEIGLIREEILRHTDITVVQQRLTLGAHELQTGDTITPNSTIFLLRRLRGGTGVHGRFHCLDVLASVLQSPLLNTNYEQTLRTYQ